MLTKKEVKMSSKLIMVIPDTQVKPGKSVAFLRSIGHYMLHKRPDIVVMLGDFADMESLSSWDKGKKSFEGRRYKADILATHKAQEALLGPLREHNLEQNAKGLPQYVPKLHMLLGNHEDRIDRAVNSQSEFEGLLSTDDLKYAEYGWEVRPFLEVLVINGVAFSHYFTTGAMQRPAGTAAALLTKRQMSCVAGHQQGRQIATAVKADGRTNTAIIAGSCYEHAEGYLGPQGNNHWRGFLFLHGVDQGEFYEQWISVEHAKKKFPERDPRGKKTAAHKAGSKVWACTPKKELT